MVCQIKYCLNSVVRVVQLAGLSITFGGTCQWLQLQCVNCVVAYELPAADCVCLAGVEILVIGSINF